jgi:3-isopropylmalate/(R)-2-methylmalate dehydratase small subunit
MSGWTRLDGQAVALAQANIDTDQLIPARFMSQSRADGYAEFLLHDVRQNTPAHPLNHHQPQVLVAGRNFGSGSSREAAVYALVDFGIRAVFAPSFGDIFAGNAVNNGLLAAVLDPEVIETLIGALATDAGTAQVDLDTGRAVIAGHDVAFALEDVHRQKLTQGWDDIDLTVQHADTISEFCAARMAAHSWAMPANQSTIMGAKASLTKGERHS